MHASSRAPSCVVCGAADARILTTTALADGTRVCVCGSHALGHRRAKETARTNTELTALTADRRTRRRRAAAGDELASLLRDAFSPSRRRAGERRGA